MSGTKIQSADRLEIEFKVAFDVMWNLAKFTDFMSQATLNSVSGRSANRILVLLFAFLRHFF